MGGPDEGNSRVGFLEREISPHDGAMVKRGRKTFLRLCNDRRRAWLSDGGFASDRLAKTHSNPLLFNDNDFARRDVAIAGSPA
jgi:uncharacterized protein with PIN domain